MSADPETYLELLERRLSLLRVLAQEFIDCRKEFVALDLDGMYRRISEQEELCREIQRIHPAILALEKKCAAQFELQAGSEGRDSESTERAARFSRVVRDLANAQAEVGRLNQIHAAYLRRSRRTIHVLMNFIGSYAITYSRPAEPAAACVAPEKG